MSGSNLYNAGTFPWTADTPQFLDGSEPSPSSAAAAAAAAAAAHGSRFDDFVTDPSYLAFQGELRDLIFHTATTAPTRIQTRATTPTLGDGVAPVDVGEAARAAAVEVAEAGRDDTNLANQDETMQMTTDEHASNDREDAIKFTANVLSQGRRVEYLENYIGQVAPWLDMFDTAGRAFGLQVPVVARTSPALLYAILALSARQQEKKYAYMSCSTDEVEAGVVHASNPNSVEASVAAPAQDRVPQPHVVAARRPTLDSLELYQEAIRRLRPLLEAHDPACVPVCTILCVMEMMSASGHDWRRHLEGCAALFDAFGVHGFSGGLFQAVFWCYVRMDLCGALISDGIEGTLVPTRKWLAPGIGPSQARDLFQATGSSDAHANYAVYLCAMVCELMADRTRFVELGEANGCDHDTFFQRWRQLWHDLQTWMHDRPAEMMPIEALDAKPFPQILFTHWAAISSNQLYHTACTLLLNMAPKNWDSPGLSTSHGLGLDNDGNDSNFPERRTIWHVRRICGISQTNPHEGCLNNAIQPLWIAGRLLTHRSEHALVVKMIRGIERQTGWATSWRIADLEVVWGYKVQ